MDESPLKPGSLAALATGEGAQSWLEPKELVASVLSFALRQVNSPRTSYARFKLCLLFLLTETTDHSGRLLQCFVWLYTCTHFLAGGLLPFFPHEAVGEAKRFAGLLWLIRTRSHLSLSFL